MENKTEKIIYWLWLSAMTDVSLNSIVSLLSCFGSAYEAYQAEPGSFYHIDGISEKDAEQLENRNLARAERILSLCKKKKIEMIPLDSEKYPGRLKEIYAPPVVLYVKGTLPDIDGNAPSAVIGTRSASEYGLKMGRSIAYELSKCGAVIVSGLTHGIDAAAAEGALEAEGTVIGVLGTEIDAARSRLAAAVAENGALISEIPPETETRRSFFRARNRIAAGIACSVVVVEAPEKSGTRLFVAEALEQGKEIYAIPSNADSESGAGSLRLLREGARLVLHGWHVAEDFPGVLDSSIREVYPEPENCDSVPPEKAISSADEKLTIDNENLPCYIEISELEDVLNSAQKEIVQFINGNSRNIDEIIEYTSLPASVVLGELTVLELMGIIKRRSGGEVELAGK